MCLDLVNEVILRRRVTMDFYRYNLCDRCPVGSDFNLPSLFVLSCPVLQHRLSYGGASFVGPRALGSSEFSSYIRRSWYISPDTDAWSRSLSHCFVVPNKSLVGVFLGLVSLVFLPTS
ncbi:20499_t:CDS:2 [Gigaspora rosea]|nr:20499_t:CDS:2 [Gigaspora rosea]